MGFPFAMPGPHSPYSKKNRPKGAAEKGIIRIVGEVCRLLTLGVATALAGQTTFLVHQVAIPTFRTDFIYRGGTVWNELLKGTNHTIFPGIQ